MEDGATVNQLQRYLQDQLVEAEDISNLEERKKRILILESSLFEVIKFLKSVEERELIESVIFEESSSVRLISSSDKGDIENTSNSEVCVKCDEPKSAEFDFCQVCGYQKK